MNVHIPSNIRQAGSKNHSSRLISYSLSTTGTIALVFSIYFDSSILAFIGLGLLFWGIVIMYISTGEYVKEAILDATTLPSMKIIDNTLIELGYEGKAVYLPPRYLTGTDSNKVFLPMHEKTDIPTPEEIPRNDRVFSMDEAALITPPGDELTKLLETISSVSFTKVDMAYVEEHLPKLLIEELEVADDVKIEEEGSTVVVSLKNSVYHEICVETNRLSNSTRSLGCPIFSAIACVIAKASGKPVVIEESQQSDNEKTISVRYRLLGEEPEEHSQ